MGTRSRLRLEPEDPANMLALAEGRERSGLPLAPGMAEFFAGDEVSPEFRARLEAASGPDPWSFGFAVVHREESLVIGMAGYKGPPVGGVVEIAYGIAPGYRDRGFATEAAGLLVAWATAQAELRTIRAHTLPARNASTRVLEKNGFVHLGAVEDPEDGTVWRWELGVGRE